MKLINSKNIILIIILLMSIFILQLANNAMLFAEEENTNDNSYIINTETEKNPTIERVVVQFKKNNLKNISLTYDLDAHEIIDFSQKKFDELEVTLINKKYLPKNENEAIVNKQYKEIVYKKSGKELINYRGNAYNVVGYYEDHKDDKIKEKIFYIGIHSPSVKNDNYYNTIKIQGDNSLKKEKIAKISEDLFEFFSMNNESEYIDTREAYVFILFLCAFLVVFNCIGFIQKWVNYKKREISIRLMVGASNQKIVQLLFKRFFAIICVSLLLGTMLSITIVNYVEETKVLTSVRVLIGRSIHPTSVLLSFIEIIAIGYILLGANIFLQFKSNSIFEKYRRC